MSIPLVHIDGFAESHCFSFTYLLTLHVDMQLLDAHPDIHLDESRVPARSESDNTQDKQCKLRLVTLRPDESWNQLGRYIAAAKHRKTTAQNVIIDFGPLSFLESDKPPVDKWDATESAVRNALALDNEPDLSSRLN